MARAVLRRGLEFTILGGGRHECASALRVSAQSRLPEVGGSCLGHSTPALRCLLLVEVAAVVRFTRVEVHTSQEVVRAAYADGDSGAIELQFAAPKSTHSRSAGG